MVALFTILRHTLLTRSSARIVVVFLLLAGCSAGSRPSAGSAATAGRVDCGIEDFGFGAGYDNQKRECFWSAFRAGTAASLTSVHRTTEGVNLTYTAIVTGPSRIDVRFVNASTDANGGTFSYSCSQLERRPVSDQPNRTSFAATSCTGRGPEVIF